MAAVNVLFNGKQYTLRDVTDPKDLHAKVSKNVFGPLFNPPHPINFFVLARDGRALLRTSEWPAGFDASQGRFEVLYPKLTDQSVLIFPDLRAFLVNARTLGELKRQALDYDSTLRARPWHLTRVAYHLTEKYRAFADEDRTAPDSSVLAAMVSGNFSSFQIFVVAAAQGGQVVRVGVAGDSQLSVTLEGVKSREDVLRGAAQGLGVDQTLIRLVTSTDQGIPDQVTVEVLRRVILHVGERVQILNVSSAKEVQQWVHDNVSDEAVLKNADLADEMWVTEPEDPKKPKADEDKEDSGPPAAGLEWVKNSCYMDSVLMALFAVPNRQVRDHLLGANVDSLAERKVGQCVDDVKKDKKARENLQAALSTVNDYIQGRLRGKRPMSCTNLRKAISKCPGFQSFHTGQMQDADEFLRYLFQRFAFERAAVVETTEMTGASDPVGAAWILRRGPHTEGVTMVNMNPADMSAEKPVRISSALSITAIQALDADYKEKQFKLKREVRRVTRADYLVINAVRQMFDGRSAKVLHTRIIIEPRVLGMDLHAIVCFIPGHYVVYIKVNEVWHKFNDIAEPQFERVGSFEQLLKYSPLPETSGCLYFYSRPEDRV